MNGSFLDHCGEASGRHGDLKEIAFDRAFLLRELFVVSTNERAVKLWQSLGYEIVARLPLAVRHPT